MWFLFALTFAFTSSLSVIVAKRVMRELDERFYLFVSGIFTIPFLLFIIIYFYQIPKVDNLFLVAVGGSIILNVIAALAAYRAIKITEVSLVAPLSAFNPVFTAIISFFILKESLETRGIIGILLICLGAYLLQMSKMRSGWLEPARQFFTNRGIQLSLLAYFIWAITPTLQKTAIFHTNPQVPPFVSLAGMIGTTAIFGLLSLKFSNPKLKLVKKFIPFFLIVGILGGIGQAAAFIAFSLTNLGFATAIFKLSMIITIILGWFFFKEHGVRDKLLGSAVMLVGVLLLILK